MCRSIDRSIAWSLNRWPDGSCARRFAWSIARSIERSSARSTTGSMDSWIAWSIDRLMFCSIGRSIAGSIVRSIARSLLVQTIVQSIARSLARALGWPLLGSRDLSFDRLVVPSLGRSIARLIVRTIDCSSDRATARSVPMKCELWTKSCAVEAAHTTRRYAKWTVSSQPRSVNCKRWFVHWRLDACLAWNVLKSCVGCLGVVLVTYLNIVKQSRATNPHNLHVWIL